MDQNLRVRLPKGPAYQCSTCGVPVDAVERVGVDDDTVTVKCEPCGHIDAIDVRALTSA